MVSDIYMLDLFSNISIFLYMKMVLKTFSTLSLSVIFNIYIYTGINDYGDYDKKKCDNRHNCQYSTIPKVRSGLMESRK